MLRQERTPRACRRAAGLEERSDERSTWQREALLPVGWLIAVLTQYRNNAPVAQLGERRSPQGGEAKHCFARSERHEPAGEWPGSRSVATRGVLLPCDARLLSDEIQSPSTKDIAPVAQLGERRLSRSGKAKAWLSPGANAASLPASGRARGALSVEGSTLQRVKRAWYCILMATEIV